MLANTDVQLNSTSNETNRFKYLNSLKRSNILKVGIPFFGSYCIPDLNRCSWCMDHVHNSLPSVYVYGARYPLL